MNFIVGWFGKRNREERRIYLDQLRSFTVLLVLVYHAVYLFNGVGVLGGIPNAESVPLFDGFCTLIYPWFMVLLFCVAGISARLSLQKRGVRDFLRERTRKLLLPSTAGLFLVHFVTGYLNIRMGGGLDYMPAFLVYPISVVSGIGPLWFIQTLFLFSFPIAVLAVLDRESRFYGLFRNFPVAAVMLLALGIWGGAQILNLPILTMYRFGIYFVAFLIGYLILSHEEVMEKLCRWRWLTLTVSVALAVLYMFLFYGENYSSDEVLKSPVTNLYLWFTVLALLGIFKGMPQRESPVGNYILRNSYGYYILHYPVLLSVCYVLHFHTSLGTVPKILLGLLLELILTFLLNELIRRIPIVRLLVLGIKTENKERSMART